MKTLKEIVEELEIRRSAVRAWESLIGVLQTKIHQGGVPASVPVDQIGTGYMPPPLQMLPIHDAPFLLASVLPHLKAAKAALAEMEEMEFDIEEEAAEDKQGDEAAGEESE